MARFTVHTKSFAPRFKNRAPAKYRDRLAIMVIYAVRPYIERAIDPSAKTFQRQMLAKGTGLVNIAMYHWQTPVIGVLQGLSSWL
jgi:hypothetical protein